MSSVHHDERHSFRENDKVAARFISFPVLPHTLTSFLSLNQIEHALVALCMHETPQGRIPDGASLQRDLGRSCYPDSRSDFG